MGGDRLVRGRGQPVCGRGQASAWAGTAHGCGMRGGIA